MQKVICLMGATCSGKTALALELTQFFDIEIVSVDSMLVYRGFDIGTAKPSVEDLQKAPHHLIDVCEFYEPYSAMNFVQDATALINEIFSKNKIPVLVGGTMLYFKALIDGLSPLPASVPEIREQIYQQAGIYGWEQMHQKLSKIDEVSASKIKPHDSQRIARALEVYEITKTPMSALNSSVNKSNFSFQQFALMPDRAFLKANIANRLQKMHQNGLLAEAQTIFNHPKFDKNLPALRAVGYKQLWQYFEKQITQDEALNLSIIATNQLAKRQTTWLKNWQHDLNIIDSQKPKQALDLLINHIAI